MNKKKECKREIFDKWNQETFVCIQWYHVNDGENFEDEQKR